MATIEESIRSMLTSQIGAQVPDSRITHAYRLQESDLPAITYEVQDTQDATIGSLKASTVTVQGIDATTIDAANLTDVITGTFNAGTYAGNHIRAIVVTSKQLLPPVVGSSDEQDPAITSVTATVYWE